MCEKKEKVATGPADDIKVMKSGQEEDDDA